MTRRAFSDEFVEGFFAWCTQMPAPLTRFQVADVWALPQETTINLLQRSAKAGKVHRTGGGTSTRWMSPTVYAKHLAERGAQRQAMAANRARRWARAEAAKLRVKRENDLESWAERMPVKRWSFVWLPVQKPPGPPSVFHLGSYV